MSAPFFDPSLAHIEPTAKRRTLGRGLAALTAEQRSDFARSGGISVPPEKRAFSVNRELAVAAGRKSAAIMAARRAAEPQTVPPKLSRGQRVSIRRAMRGNPSFRDAGTGQVVKLGADTVLVAVDGQGVFWIGRVRLTVAPEEA